MQQVVVEVVAEQAADVDGVLGRLLGVDPADEIEAVRGQEVALADEQCAGVAALVAIDDPDVDLCDVMVGQLRQDRGAFCLGVGCDVEGVGNRNGPDPGHHLVDEVVVVDVGQDADPEPRARRPHRDLVTDDLEEREVGVDVAGLGSARECSPQRGEREVGLLQLGEHPAA